MVIIREGFYITKFSDLDVGDIFTTDINTCMVFMKINRNKTNNIVAVCLNNGNTYEHDDIFTCFSSICKVNAKLTYSLSEK